MSIQSDKKIICELLLTQGIKPKYKGFLYLTEILFLMDNTMTNLNKIYEKVSEKYAVTRESVYQDVRYAIMNISYKKLLEMEPILNDEFYPTNKNYIYYIKTIYLKKY